MPRFSEFFNLGLSQHQLDFVDINNECDTRVYVDPYAIEIRDDIWAADASEHIRVFFLEVLAALKDGDDERAMGLMGHLGEPRETFLGVSTGEPKGRGVGRLQALQLIASIRQSKAFSSGLLSDLSEMSLYVEGIDRDKISDLTTNIIRFLLVEYTQQQCEILGIPIRAYSGPPGWDKNRRNWLSKMVDLPFIDNSPVILIPKYIVRRKLSLDSQEFYNKQITDFLVSENLRANSSLVQTIKGQQKVFKGDVRKENPKTKNYVADMVAAHPELLEIYKNIAKRQKIITSFNDNDPSINVVCNTLADIFANIPAGAQHAEDYHLLAMGTLTAIFHPDLIMPHKEWEIHGGRKRIDLVYTNAADTGFFAQRRDDRNLNANTVIVECKNYSNDIANNEVDQLLGRFDNNRGKFGILTCRGVDNPNLLLERCRDAAVRQQGYIITLTDDEMVQMLRAKAEMRDEEIMPFLHRKYRQLLA
jgi:hypothetical protein